MQTTILQPDFSAVEAEVLVIGMTEHPENQKDWNALVEAVHPRLAEWVKKEDISTKFNKLSKLPATTDCGWDRIYFIGLGKKDELTVDRLREIFATVGKESKVGNISSLAIATSFFTSSTITEEDVAYTIAEGIGMGSYAFEGYRTDSNEASIQLRAVQLLTTADPQEVKASFEVGQIYAQAVNEARTLVNLPPNLLTPKQMGQYAKEMAAHYDFDITVLGKKEMEELGMGAILAVNKGSVEEPQLIVLKYQGQDHWEDVVGLVGKGITYDTGGYSLKPREGMVGMKGDMGGAAAVLGAMRIIGELRPAKNVIAVIASTDNMISGDAFKPDDVITSLSGKTIEVLNTDAEGRLVLADAVTYALQSGANYIVDVATLTGGVIVALGKDKTGALTNNEAFFEAFMEASLETGEFVWRLPLTEQDRKRIRKSDVADLNNSPGRDGHMIFGGGFVGEFVGNTPWVHLDIAGTSEADGPHALGPKGATGVMVRTLATLIERMD